MDRVLRMIVIVFLLVVLIALIFGAITDPSAAARMLTGAINWQMARVAAAIDAPPLVRSEPYHHSAYFSPAFVAERDRSRTPDDFADPIPPDESGQWFNVRAGVRMTTDQPLSADHTLWLYGNSVLFGVDVPDNLTITSYLQRDIGSVERVENLGMSAALAVNQFLRLKVTPLRPGDSVVWLDGATDGLDVYFGRGQTIEAYHETLSEAELWCAEHAVTFYHFYQPTIWSRPLTAYERTLRGSNYKVDTARWNRMWADLTSLPGVDLTHTLDAVRQNDSIMFDETHFNEVGNENVARAIYDALFPVF